MDSNGTLRRAAAAKVPENDGFEVAYPQRK